MIIEFELPIKAFSINAYYYKDRRHKTAAAKAWEKEVLELLKQVPNLNSFATDYIYNGNLYSFEVFFTVQYPKNVFYNAKGFISAKTFDCSNTEKVFIDLLFNQVIGIDDRYITALHSFKVPGDSYKLKIQIQWIPRID